MQIFRFTICLAVSCLCDLPMTAQSQWVQWPGPFSGDAIGVKSSKGRLICATTNGLYESIDQGGHWKPWSGGQRRLPEFYSRPFFELSGDTAYFSGWEGVFRSTDKGFSWDLIFERKKISDWEYEVPLKLLIEPNKTLYLNTSKSVWRSLDGGSNWHRLESAPAPGFGGSICESNGNLFISYGEKIFKSGDAGDSWEEIFQTGSAIGNLQTFDGVLLAFTSGWPKDTIWRSDDEGATWQMNETDGLPYLHSSGKMAAFHDKLVYLAEDNGVGSSLSFSQDGGISWTALWEKPLFQYNVREACFADSMLLLVSRTGILRGFANDSMPLKANNGIIGEEIYNIVRQPNAWLVSTSSGVYRTKDEGKNWDYVLFCDEDGIYHQWNKIFFAGKNMVYKGAFFTYYSKDGGETWDVLNLPGTISCLLENFAENDAGIWVISPYNHRLYWWKTGEAHFELQLFNPPNGDKAIRAFAKNNCVAILTEKNFLHYSFDLGKHWQVAAANPIVSYYSKLLHADVSRLVFDTYNGTWDFDAVEKKWSKLTPVNVVSGDTIHIFHFMSPYQGLFLSGGAGNGLLFCADKSLEKWYPVDLQIPIGDAISAQISNGKIVIGTDGFGLWENAAPKVSWEGDDNTFIIAPNPSPSAILHSFSILVSPIFVKVFSADGSFIREMHFPPGRRWDLGLHDLPSGMYAIAIAVEENSFVLKWVKN